MIGHLHFLKGAVEAGSLPLTVDYLAWCRERFSTAGLPVDRLARLVDVLTSDARRHEGEYGPAFEEMLHQALGVIAAEPDRRSAACEEKPLDGVAAQYLNALLSYDLRRSEQLVEAVADRVSPTSVYLDVVSPALHEVGRLWQAGRISEAEEHYISASTQMILSHLFPRVFATSTQGPVLLAACVEGELHEIGLRMLADVFQLNGWDTRFMGANVPSAALAKMVERSNAVVALSAMTSASLPAMAAQIRAIRATAHGAARIILVGGYPFKVDGELWRRLGADGSAADARDALVLAANLTGG